jgi:hypothetical protein
MYVIAVLDWSSARGLAGDLQSDTLVFSNAHSSDLVSCSEGWNRYFQNEEVLYTRGVQKLLKK